MNTERLHAITIAVLNDLKSTKSVETLEQLVAALQSQVNQPQVPQYQQQVSNHLKILYDGLSAAPSNDFSPAWKQATQELGLHDLLGKNLQAHIKEIFERNAITPSVALTELQTIHQQLTTRKKALEQIVSSFKQVGIGAEELQPGQCEIGVLIPRLAVQNKLGEFIKELDEFNGIFGTFAELTIGQRPGFEIRSISSSDFSFLFDMLPVIAASVAVAVERIVRVYKDILEIRKLHGELKNRGVPKQQLKGINEYANSQMKVEIEKLVKELVEKYYKSNDEGRRNELTIALHFSLDKIANRIDKSYSIEVRAEPPAKEGEEGGEKKMTPKDKEYINIVRSISKDIEYIKLPGPTILSLPESQKAKRSRSTKKKKP